MNAARLAMLAVFAGLSMNLFLQCGLCLGGLPAGDRKPLPFARTLMIFAGAFFLWLVFNYILPFFSTGLFEYILVFPVSFAVHRGIDYAYRRFVLKKDADSRGQLVFCEGLTASALFVTLNAAAGILEALVLCAFFSAGILFAFCALAEISRRSGMEKVPRFLRGKALPIISMGLLSLVSGSAALILYRALGAE
jgi:electron transport complex protein RnfA